MYLFANLGLVELKTFPHRLMKSPPYICKMKLGAKK